MRRYYGWGWNDFQVLPEDLSAFAWSAPMRELAAKVGMSDVGLKKLLASCGIVAPPQGYWNKLRAGKPVPSRPKGPTRRPGETGRLRLDSRFASLLPTANPISSTGPFKSALVPEDLEELRIQELKVIGRVSVPKTLDVPHKGLRDLLLREKRRQEKVAGREWHWDPPKFDTPLAKRRLRILNGIFLALAKRGHGGHVSDQNGELHAEAVVGDTGVGLNLVIAGKHRTVRQYGRVYPAPDLPASTPLSLRISSPFTEEVEVFSDGSDDKLEGKLAAITAAIIVAGEAGFRRGLSVAEERREQERREAEKRRQEMRAELNRQRLANLRVSGELLQRAENLRALVTRVREAALCGTAEIEGRVLEAWATWALDQADQIDPVKSGQIMSHIKPPTLNNEPEVDC